MSSTQPAAVDSERVETGLAPLPGPPLLLNQVPLERIESEITELAAHISAATYRLLCLLSEFDRRLGWAEWGCRSCVQWLNWRCGLGTGAARDHLRVAHKLQDMSRVAAAFAAGELSYSKVRALSRIVTADNEEHLLTWARYSTAADIERLSRNYRRALTADEGAEARYERRRLCTFPAEDGSVIIRARLTPEDAALVLKSLDAAGKALQTSDDSNEDGVKPGNEGEPGWIRMDKRRADALVAIAETSLETGVLSRSNPDRYQVIVHVDAETIAADSAPSICELEDGHEIFPETARRIACDSSVVPLLRSGGETVDVGRMRRTPNRALRRALAARDRTCRFPGCQSRVYLDAHHIHHWTRGGSTNLENLCRLCSFHHHLVHEGGFGVKVASDGSLIFLTPDGGEIESAPVARCNGTIQATNYEIGLEIDSETGVPLWDGSPMDQDAAVGVLLQNELLRDICSN